MVYSVLVIEDQISEEVVRKAFEGDAAKRPGGPRLELVGLAQNHTDAIDQLEAFGSGGAGLPDVIVIDDHLPDESSTSSRTVQIMRWLLARCLELELPLHERPRTVLWSVCEPNLVYTFCAFGGLQYQDKQDPDGASPPVAAIWRALAGQRWRPDPFPDERDLSEAFRRALPYLDHGWSQDATARRLSISARTLAQFTSKAQKLALAPGRASDDFPTNTPSSLRVVKANGWVWVPYPLVEQLPAGMPLPSVIDPVAHRVDLPPRGEIPEEHRGRPVS